MKVEKVNCSTNGGHIIRQYAEYPQPGMAVREAATTYRYYCEKCGASLAEIREDDNATNPSTSHSTT